MERNATHPRSLSTDFAPRPKSPSMLYSILPSAVQSRLLKLPSLRRSVSMYGLPTRRPASAPGSGAQTPEAGFGNAMVLSGQAEEKLYLLEGMSSDEDLAAERKMLDDGKSGIGWKFANQGLNLLSLAVEEYNTLSRDPRDPRYGNASLARQLYIHALTYLLRALPIDLTAEEKLSVRSALPSGVVDPLPLHPAYSPPPLSAANQPSLLHRMLASTIVQFFILLQFLLPYLKYILSAAYTYEREHKISEKVLSQSLETVDAVGGMVGVVCGMGDGKVGQIFGDMVSWVVEGVTGGIHEGVGEGMAVLRVAGKRPMGPARV